MKLEFIEAPLFTKKIHEYLDDEEFSALQWRLVSEPEAGVLIPETGGVRKLRWGAKGKGKRGGIRVIYYFKSNEGEIWLLTVYAKNEVEDISRAVLRKLREEIDNET